MDVRLSVSLPANLAKAVDDFRFANRVDTRGEAIRQLLLAGLDAKGVKVEAAKEAGTE